MSRRHQRGRAGAARSGTAPAVLLGLALAAAAAASTPVKIHPIGDSITRGDDSYPSYRYYLEDLMQGRPVSFNYVGSLNGAGSGGGYDATTYTGFDDLDHDGHGGWKTHDIRHGKSGQGPVSVWANAYRPDIACIFLGTNDVSGGVPAATSKANLVDIIGQLRAGTANPNVEVYVAQIIPRSSASPATVALNAKIAELDDELTTHTSHVHVVDLHTGFNPATMLNDTVHPNALGDSFIAQRFFEAMFPATPGVIDFSTCWNNSTHADDVDWHWQPPMGACPDGVEMAWHSSNYRVHDEGGNKCLQWLEGKNHLHFMASNAPLDFDSEAARVHCLKVKGAGRITIKGYNDGVDNPSGSDFLWSRTVDLNGSWQQVACSGTDVVDSLVWEWDGTPGTLYIDDISFVPEPVGLSVLGLGGVLLLRRRRRAG